MTEKPDYIKERIKLITELVKLVFSLFLTTVAGTFVLVEKPDLDNKSGFLIIYGGFFCLVTLGVIIVLISYMFEYMKYLNR
ncbi:hypothetical protein GO730_21010 [Spirosoma sp. HMF3257]|nr:hypothetical protein [Spirosoma telluris]